MIFEDYQFNLIMEENQHLRSSLIEIHTGKKSHVAVLLLASLQIATGYLLEWTPTIVSLIFIGNYGSTDEQSALGLGIMWTNVFGFGIFNALAAGLETITAQAYGSRSYNTTSLQFWQCTWVQSFSIVPVSGVLISSKWVLAWLPIEGQETSDEASNVAIGLIYAVLMNGFYASTKGFLNGQYIYGLTLITQIFTASSHILSCYIFIVRLELGIYGAVLARSVTETLNLFIIWVVIYFKGCCQETLQKPTKESLELQGLKGFLKQTIPIGLLYELEWIGYELYTFQASRLSKSAFAACVIMNNFGSFYYQIANGISIAGSTFIGNSMGANEPKDAQAFSKTSLLITLLFILLSLVPIFIFREPFGHMFTNDKDVHSELMSVFLIFCISQANDSMQVMLTGIVRSIGYETQACYLFLALYLVVGQIACYLLTAVANLGIEGVLLATMGTVTTYDIIIIAIILTAKWNQKAEEISQSYKEKEAKYSLQTIENEK